MPEGFYLNPKIERLMAALAGRYRHHPQLAFLDIAFAIDQPDDVDVNEIIVRPTRQRP